MFEKTKAKTARFWDRHGDKVVFFGTCFVTGLGLGIIAGTSKQEGYRLGKAEAKNEMYEIVFGALTEVKVLNGPSA